VAFRRTARTPCLTQCNVDSGDGRLAQPTQREERAFSKRCEGWCALRVKASLAGSVFLRAAQAGRLVAHVIRLTAVCGDLLGEVGPHQHLRHTNPGVVDVPEVLLEGIVEDVEFYRIDLEASSIADAA